MATTTAPVVSLCGVTFGYPPKGAAAPALKDVSLDVEPLDFLGVIGPNGGGKTTLLKLILGFLKPQIGNVTVLGRPPIAVRRRIGYVPQHASVDASAPASVLDIALMGRLGGSSWGAWFGRKHVAAAMSSLHETGTAHLAQRRFGSLSGGERQRVLIARALAADVRLLLLDEPTAGVDEHMERSLINLLHRLNEAMPIVIVSHDIAFVSRHLKRVACLNRRLTVHAAAEISQEVISGMYHDEMSAVRHRAECPLSDPGCDWDHAADRGQRARADGPPPPV